MSAPLTGRCPECGGPRLLRHPSGFTWQHELHCPLLAAEDATAAADADRAARRRARPSWYRPTTPAERQLLAACGIQLPTVAFTKVTVLSAGLRHRSWKDVTLDPAPDPAPVPDPVEPELDPDYWARDEPEVWPVPSPAEQW